MPRVLRSMNFDKVWKILEDESRWCKGEAYRDSEGRNCGSVKATCCCILGGLSIVYGNQMLPYVEKVKEAIGTEVCKAMSVSYFNDNYPHDTIIKVLKEIDV